MGQINNKRIIILIICLTFSFIIVSYKPSSNVVAKKIKLNNAITNYPSWRSLANIPLDKPIIDALLLDDYINMKFTNKKSIISLYIGYYYSTKKVGAAHDPIVCFPGQGWKISDTKTGKHTLKSGDTISYSMMTGQLGQQKELILYWFQSYDVTNSNTFSQKITLLWKKILQQGEDNAFVRITIPFENQTETQLKETVLNFINEFYPVFSEYVKKG